MTNQSIASLLRDVAAAYTIKNENKFRFQIIAYQRAADAIEGTTTEIRDLIKEGKLEQVPGVGPSIGKYLEELIKTGKVKHFEWVMSDIPKSVFPLLQIPTMGPKKSYRLVKEFKLIHPEKVIDDLEKLGKQGKIASIEGFGERSQSDILRAIGEYRLGKGKTTRMVLPYAFELAAKLVNYLKKSKAVVRAEPLGSLRRMVSTIGDIDIAVATNEPKTVIEHFLSYPYKERVIEKGSTTASILVSSGRQIDLMTQPPKSFGSLLQHFTGSKNHNVHLREFALKKGISLSEYGIKKQMENARLPAGQGKWKMENFESEETFYKAIGLDWIPPEIREDAGEIELAAKHKLPSLIELGDIRGDLHIHSSFPIEPSHDMGKNSMEEMLEEANRLNYQYLGFSEHNPSTSKHTSAQIVSIMKKRKEKIEQIKSSNKYIRIINLLEVDILPNGNLALNDKALDLVDAILVSIHSVFSLSKKDMTKRILKGLSHPKAKIFSHPTGRLLNQRAGYDIDFDILFDFCKKNNKALEINAWPPRLDLPDIMVRQAVNLDVKMVIDTDSHALEQMILMKYGVAVARRGWAGKKDIINTLPYDEFVAWLRR